MKRLLLIFLSFCLLLTAAAPAYAVEVEAFTSKEYTLSDSGLAFVKEMSGKNYAGTETLRSAQSAVTELANRYELTFTQAQADALIDFVLCYGAYILRSNYRVERVLAQKQYSEVELANAMLAWVKNGSSFSQKNYERRIRELQLFFYDDYAGTSTPGFSCLIFDANGGTSEGNLVQAYAVGEAYEKTEPLPSASRSGAYFAGWFTADGTQVVNTMTVGKTLNVSARWSDEPIDGDPNDRPLPTEPTEPNPTEPTEPTDPEPELPTLKTSEKGIQFIKDHEGFLKYAVWDYSQWTIGYGTRCEGPDEYPDGITEEQADALLRKMLADFEAVVDNFLAEKATYKHSQAQYDAIISFTFNLGQQWMRSNYAIYYAILEPVADEMDFVNTMGAWINAGGQALDGLALRRIDEACLFLHGEYELGNTRYMRIVFNAAGGTCGMNWHYYRTGEALAALPTPTREGYRFVGWYDKVEGGKLYTEETTTPTAKNLRLYAHWELAPVDPTDPTDPTEPVDPTDPANPTNPTEPVEPTEPTEPKPEEPEIEFSDVKKGQWFYDSVMRSVKLGLFRGTSATTFEPETAMSRAMILMVLYRMAGSPEVTKGTPFVDVPSTAWYADAVAWGVSEGIVMGVSTTQFCPDDEVEREQLVTFLFRFAERYGYDTSARADLSAFSDASKILDYAREPMQWAVGCGIMDGMGGALKPREKATRAQCAKLVVYFFDRYSDTN